MEKFVEHNVKRIGRWKIEEVHIGNYKYSKDATFVVMFTLSPGFISVREPSPVEILKKIAGTYRGEKRRVAVSPSTYHYQDEYDYLEASFCDFLEERDVAIKRNVIKGGRWKWICFLENDWEKFTDKEAERRAEDFAITSDNLMTGRLMGYGG